jgi:NAD(P)-dependent dehydrogenase (short-subunit alcohol dehydrogenase family)
VAAITGGADGLGFAIAQRLMAEGATMWLLDRDEARVKAAAAKLALARAHAVDIVDERGAQTAFEKIFSEHQRLDAVVNSAGIVGPNNRKITETATGDSHRDGRRDGSGAGEIHDRQDPAKRCGTLDEVASLASWILSCAPSAARHSLGARTRLCV